MGWFNNKASEIHDAFDAFPKVKWLTIFYIVLAFLVMWFYFPFINGLANFEVLPNIQPFHSIIEDNFKVLRWSVFLLPLIILAYGFADANELYHEKLNKLKY